MSFKVQFTDYKSAKYAVEHWHYSRRMPRFKQVYLGVMEDDKFIGCVIFGLSVTAFIGDAYGLKNTECAELTRIALREHRTPVSQIVSVCIRMLRKQSPGLRLLVSYADPFQNHNGSIYQAMNWTYVGRSSAVHQFYFRGAWRNDSSLNRVFKKYPEIKKQVMTRDVPPKHKYLYVLDQSLREKIAALAVEYPKKNASEVKEDTPGYHPGEGGATPTPTLIEKGQ